MYRRNVEMGEYFTGVKNQKLTWLAVVLATGILVAGATEMSLVQPPDLAAQLSAKGAAPALFMVGPNVLYRSRHITASVFAGPGQTHDGLALLQAAADKLPRDREVLVYCGCCPWDHCPNVKPSVNLLKLMGFTKVKVLYLPTGFKVDWLDKGYAAETPR
jgi:thiosulfate/3-mercaptopyruvate sulfurtransferase